MTPRLAAIALGSTLVAAAGLRCVDLSDRSIWFDEAFTYTLVTRFPAWEVVRRTADDVHPPLYYLVLQTWVACFGTSVVSLRAPSVLFGTAAVGMAYLVARTGLVGRAADEAARRRARAFGVVAAALVATSAVQVQWSGEARMYSLATLLLLTSSWCALRALRAPRRRANRWWAAYAASAAAMLYTHNYAIFSFAGQAVWIAAEYRRRAVGLPARLAVARAVPAASALAAAGWLYLPWVPTLLEQKARVQENYWIEPSGLMTVARAWYSLFVPANGGHAPGVVGPIAVAGGLLATGGVLLKRPQPVDRLVLATVFVPVAAAYAVSQVSVSIIVDRHFLLAHLLALVGAARVVERLFAGGACWCVTSLLVFDGLFVLNGYREDLRVDERPGLRAAVEHVLDRRRPGEPLLVAHPCLFFGVRYYAAGRAAPKLWTPPENVSHYTGGPLLLPGDMAPSPASESSRGRRIWVLDTSGYAPGYTRGPVPPSWRWRSSESFPEVYFFQGQISVDEYYDEGTAASRPTAGRRATPPGTEPEEAT